MTSELARHDAVGLAELVRTGELSPVELIDDTIARIETLNPQVNAIIHPAFEKARAAAAGDLPDGPFRGVPMLMKDLWPAEKGEPFHQGVQGLKNTGYIADVDANIVTAYKRAGFVMSGRTNTPEMGLSATTEPVAYGPTRNPWDLDRGAGGSSGGAAAAVAAGMLPAANASDGGGSIRIPAAMCGLVGLKPSRGRISMGPQRDEWGNSVQHVVSHTVRDSAAILDATAAPFPGDGVIAPFPDRPFLDFLSDDPRPLRIGVLDRSIRDGIPIDPDVAAAVRDVADQLEQLGHEIVDDSPAALDDQALIASYGAQWSAAVAASLDTFGEWIGRELTADDVEPMTWALAERGRRLGAVEAARAADQAMIFRHRMADWWASSADLLLAPTCLRPAPLIGESSGTAENPFENIHVTLAYATLTAPFNTTGQPAISLPLAQSSAGLPIGIQFVGAYGREDLLLQLAGQLERAMPWADQRSPLHP
ncbi:MAG: amidase [Acidimicrobiales bacterium]|nr:MAG: amidase [Acidimicrobiales bacterium]